MPFPTRDDVKTYLGSNAAGTSDAVIDAVLEAEQAAQGRVCRVDRANYPADLREALFRRVARNIAMRNIPLGVQGDAEFGGIRVGYSDPEVRRLEGPHKRMTVA